ncbi:MAG: glycoside hydrolase family 5 protein, partial [Clostridiales bacterium]|nr:glycoside hydrolase family 5 protein [Clostridiales bacterium]
EMIQDVINAGFNVIRIPVTWDQHIIKEENYRIDSEWMARVKEVVDYAYGQGVYVILNTHHEDRWLYPSKEREEESIRELVAVWEQIAKTFKEYDERLLFEGVNEPRLVGTEDEWNGGNQEAWDIVNHMNQAFIDTVRASGGNNKYRHLLITDYADSTNINALKALVIPSDSRVIVTVHSYLPYNLALENSEVSTFDPANPNDTTEIDNLMKDLKELFIDQGVPVIIGEYGVRDKDNLEDRVAATEYFVSAANKLGIPCVWWDNGAFDGTNENFGLYDRKHRTWPYPEILNTIMESTK